MPTYLDLNLPRSMSSSLIEREFQRSEAREVNLWSETGIDCSIGIHRFSKNTAVESRFLKEEKQEESHGSVFQNSLKLKSSSKEPENIPDFLNYPEIIEKQIDYGNLPPQIQPWMLPQGEKAKGSFMSFFRGRKSRRNASKGDEKGNEKKKDDKNGKKGKDEKKSDPNKGDDDDEKKKKPKDDADGAESSSDESSSEEDDDNDEKEEEEDENYDIRKDPDFADLEIESIFPEDPSESAVESILEAPRAEFYDVLDKFQQVEERDLSIERKLAKRKIIPSAPVGGWRWRSAKFIGEESPEDEEGVLWKFQFLDGDKGEISINVKEDESFVAPFETKTKLDSFHKFKKDDKVDVLDYFISKRSKLKMQKWREAKVVKADPYWIRISYTNWASVWDEWLHVYQDRNRIAEFSKMTQRIHRRIKRRKNNFQIVLNRKRSLQLVEMAADGNCLFRTVAHQVYGTPEKHRKVRDECVTYMEQNAKRFAMFVGDIRLHVMKMRQDKEWGDDTEIRAMEEVYDRPFEIYFVNGLGINYKPTKTNFDGDLPKRIKKVEPIRLSYHGKCHYNSIVSLSQKMKVKDKSFPPPPRRTTKLIKLHREKMLRRAEKEEKRIKREAREKERLEKERKLKEEQEEAASKEEKQEEDEGESKILRQKSSQIIVIKPGSGDERTSEDKSSNDQPEQIDEEEIESDKKKEIVSDKKGEIVDKKHKLAVSL